MPLHDRPTTPIDSDLFGEQVKVKVLKKIRHELPDFRDNQIKIQTIKRSATAQSNNQTDVRMKHYKLAPNIPDLE
jgi:hypothetical protein